MLDMKDRIDLIRDISKLPAEIREAVQGLDQDQLDIAYGEGKWTIRQVVHHLADAHMNAVIRMKNILTEDSPTLKTYEQDRWAELADTYAAPLELSLQILEGLHQRWTLFLESLEPDEWQRAGIHPEIGRVTLENLLLIYAKHGQTHLAKIKEFRKEMGW